MSATSPEGAARCHAADTDRERERRRRRRRRRLDRFSSKSEVALECVGRVPPRFPPKARFQNQSGQPYMDHRIHACMLVVLTRVVRSNFIQRTLPFAADASSIMHFDETGLGIDLIDRETHETATAPQNDSRFTGWFDAFRSLPRHCSARLLFPTNIFNNRLTKTSCSHGPRTQ